MTQTLLRALEWLELDPNELGFSPFAADGFSIPRVLRLGGGESVVWAELDWERADIEKLTAILAKLNGAGGKLETPDAALAFLLPSTTPTSNMLGAFIRIQDEHDVLKFAQRYGPLRLCMHGFPAGPSYSPMWVKHHPHFKLRPWCEPVRAEGIPAAAPMAAKWRDMTAKLPVIFFQEKVSDWLRFVRIAQALLSIGLADRAKVAGYTGYSRKGGERIGGRADWETLFRDWFLSPSPEDRANNVFNDLAHGRTLAPMIVSSITDEWIRMGQVHPSLRWGSGDTKPSLDLSTSTFGHLGIQLAEILAGAKKFTFCNDCGSLYSRSGRAIYCPDCRAAKVPARDRKRRFRVQHPDYDRTYRARRLEMKGETNEQARE